MQLEADVAQVVLELVAIIQQVIQDGGIVSVGRGPVTTGGSHGGLIADWRRGGDEGDEVESLAGAAAARLATQGLGGDGVWLKRSAGQLGGVQESVGGAECKWGGDSCGSGSAEAENLTEGEGACTGKIESQVSGEATLKEVEVLERGGGGYDGVMVVSDESVEGADREGARLMDGGAGGLKWRWRGTVRAVEVLVAATRRVRRGCVRVGTEGGNLADA